MSDGITKIGMRPAHPGEFIRDEILAELDLSVARAAEILGVRCAPLSDLVNGKTALSPEMALRIEKAFGVNMDMAAAHAGMARRTHDAPPGQRSPREALSPAFGRTALTVGFAGAADPLRRL